MFMFMLFPRPLMFSVYGYVFYLSFATAAYLTVFDHSQMKHPKFLKNQVGVSGYR